MTSGSNPEEIYSHTQVAALRIFIAFLFMLPWVFKHVRNIEKSKWFPLFVVGLLGNGIPAFLFAAAQTNLDSSYIGMLNSLVPLFTLLIGLAAFKVKVHKFNIVGVLIGLVGAVGLMLSQGVTVEGDLVFYSSLVIAATICYAISVNTIRNYLTGIPSAAITAVAFIFIGIPTGIYLFTTDFVEVLTTNTHGYAGLGYVAVLAIVGTALAVILFNQLIKMTSSLFAASVTYLIPIVAIFWGVIDGETVTLMPILFCFVILAGVYLVNFKPKVQQQ